jgi:integrase
VTVAALRLAPLVFVRPGELRNARWANVDFDNAEWQFTANKTGTPHIVPLSEQALEILRDLHPLTSRGEYVFPSVRSMKRPMSENTVNAAMRYMGIDRETMSGHGSRTMARTIRTAAPTTAPPTCRTLGHYRHHAALTGDELPATQALKHTVQAARAGGGHDAPQPPTAAGEVPP